VGAKVYSTQSAVGGKIFDLNLYIYSYTVSDFGI